MLSARSREDLLEHIETIEALQTERTKDELQAEHDALADKQDSSPRSHQKMQKALVAGFGVGFIVMLVQGNHSVASYAGWAAIQAITHEYTRFMHRRNQQGREEQMAGLREMAEDARSRAEIDHDIVGRLHQMADTFYWALKDAGVHGPIAHTNIGDVLKAGRVLTGRRFAQQPGWE
jgi:hypothetical protein